MNIEEYLDQLDDMLEQGWSFPGGRRVIDVEKIRNLVDDIRLQIPAEVKQAKGIVSDRADIITTAKREAEGIIKSAEERARAMVAQEEITKLAQAKAHEIIAAAQAKSRDMRKAAQDFVDDLLKRTEEDLSKHMADLRHTRQMLRKPASRED